MNLTNEELDNLVDDLNGDFHRCVLPVTVFIGLETAIGLIGNFLVIYVVVLYYKTSNFKYFVLCLAVIDVTCCIITLPSEMNSQTRWYEYSSKAWCKIKSFSNVFTVVAEALCLLTIAVDRYRKVCQPLRWQIKPRFAKYWCFLLFLVALPFAFPVFFLWGLRTASTEYNGVKINYTICEKDAFFEGTNYPLIHLSSVATFVCILLIAMLAQYIAVAKTLLGKRMGRANSSSPMVNSAAVVSQKSSTDTSKPETKSSEVETSDVISDVKTTEISDVRFTTGSWSSDGDDAGVPENEPVQSSNNILSTNATGKCPNSQSYNGIPTEDSEHVAADALKFANRVRRKTLIMFIITITFILTIIIYFVLINIMASSHDYMETLNNDAKSAWFFFLRLYFINHVINPIVYGFLDPQFKTGLKRIKQNIVKKFSKNVHS